MKSFLETIQGNVAQHLNMDPNLKEVPVISHCPSDYRSELQKLAQTGAGTTIVVMNPIPTAVISTEEGLSFEEIIIKVQVIETPMKTSKTPPAIAVVEAVMQRLDHYSPELEDWNGWLELIDKGPVRLVKDIDRLDRTILEVHFKAGGSR